MSREISVEPTRKIFIKPYSTLELAHLYGVSKKTIHRWLKPFRAEIGARIGHFYTIPQVKIIFEKLDYPEMSVVRINENPT